MRLAESQLKQQFLCKVGDIGNASSFTWSEACIVTEGEDSAALETGF